MKHALRSFVFSLLLVFTCFSVSATETFKLTILHTNDLHGMMRPHEYQNVLAFLSGQRGTRGGLARRATLISQIRRETKHPVVVVDNGDLFTDGPWAEKWFGVPEIEALNAMKYDLFAVGNNELKATLDTTAQSKMLTLVRRSRFPWLAANLTVTGSNAQVEGIHPFIVHRYGDVRVGFLGLITGQAVFEWIKGWSVEDPITAAKRWVPIARRECDILIVTAHLGDEAAQELIRQVSGIDAVVDGHSHTFTPTPVMVKNPDGHMVPVVQAGEKGVVLGRFDLTFTHDDRWQLLDAKEKLIPITSAIREDRAVRKLLERYLDATKESSPLKKTPIPALAPIG